MPDPLQHVSPGDPLALSAASWNALTDAARRLRAEPRRDGGRGPAEADALGPAVVVRVRNTTGATLPPHSILTPSGAVVDPDLDDPLEARRRPVVDASAPVADTDAIVILYESAPYQGLGRAVAAGVTVATVDITDTGHRYARPIPGDRTKLASAESGPVRLLVPAGATGEQMVYVLLGGGAVAPAASSGSSTWLADLADTECVRATISGTPGGACSGIDAEQDIILSFSETNSRWESAAGAFASTGTSATATISYTPGTPVPTAAIGDTQGVYLGADGSGGVLFAFGGVELCGDGRTTCNNGFVVRFGCACCPVDGWDGPGWYCILFSGADCETGTQRVAELLDGDQCDPELVICSGPYATFELADAECGSGAGTVDTPCCDDPMPEVLYVTVTGATGTWASAVPSNFVITWNAGLNVWENNDIGGCTVGGFAIRFALGCDGSFGSNILVANAVPDTGTLCARPIDLAYSGFTSSNCCAGAGTPCTGALSLTITE